MTETQAYWYSYKSTQRELSNEYQDDRVQMVSKDLCILVLRTKVASALEGLTLLHYFFAQFDPFFFITFLFFFFLGNEWK